MNVVTICCIIAFSILCFKFYATFCYCNDLLLFSLILIWMWAVCQHLDSMINRICSGFMICYIPPENHSSSSFRSAPKDRLILTLFF